MKIRSVLVLGVAILVTGCGSDPAPLPQAMPVTGTVKFADGKPVSDLTVEFAPQTSAQTGGTGVLDAAGKYEAKVGPGKFYVVIADKTGKSPTMAHVPKSYQSPNPENTVEVPSGGGTVDITLK